MFWGANHKEISACPLGHASLAIAACWHGLQMSRMLDVLESFLNIHAHTYMRLDGSTKPEQRQVLMQVGRQAGRASFWHT